MNTFGKYVLKKVDDTEGYSSYIYNYEFVKPHLDLMRMAGKPIVELEKSSL